MKQGFAIVVAALVLGACTPQVPDSGAGVGFNDYANYELERAQREAALNGTGSTNFQAPVAVGTAPIATSSGGISSAELAGAGIGGTQAAPGVGAPLSALDPNRTQGVQATPGNAQPVLANNPGISDEQDFAAVSGRETIESDAQRRAANAAALVQVQPVAVPVRPSNTGPNIVEYAINAPNRKGQEWYSRSIFAGQGRFQRNCAGYGSPDAAQRDFLSRGGPERDARGIDPDGDGFACGWDPAPFRLAAGN